MPPSKRTVSGIGMVNVGISKGLEGGNEATNGSGVTQFAEGEPKSKNPTLRSPDGECVIPFAYAHSITAFHQSFFISDLIFSTTCSTFRSSVWTKMASGAGLSGPTARDSSSRSRSKMDSKTLWKSADSPFS